MMGGEDMDYIVESALLTHGIKDLSEDVFRHYWGDDPSKIVWVEKGKLIIGTLERFLPFREKAVAAAREGRMTRRANHFNLDTYLEMEEDAVLTASGALSVCAREGIDAAVTAGIGGFFPELLEDNGKHLWTKGDGPPDVATLTSLDKILISSGPKDMLDYPGTIRFLHEHGVSVCGVKRDIYTGYLFIGEAAELPDMIQDARGMKGPALIINEIDETKRMSDRSILDEAVLCGLETEKRGGYYHPAVNACIEEKTSGYSARLQLAALLDNARLAAKL